MNHFELTVSQPVVNTLKTQYSMAVNSLGYRTPWTPHPTPKCSNCIAFNLMMNFLSGLKFDAVIFEVLRNLTFICFDLI